MRCFFLNTITIFTAGRNSKTMFSMESTQKHSLLGNKNKKTFPIDGKLTMSTNQKMILLIQVACTIVPAGHVYQKAKTIEKWAM